MIYIFKLKKILNVTEQDNDQINLYGYFPSNLSELSGNY